MATQEKRIDVYRILQLWCSEKRNLPLERRREFESLFQLESEYNTPTAVADVTGKDESEPVETETERCYGSCECWVVSLTSGDRERRNAADPLGRPGEERLQIFVLRDRNKPEVQLLGTFRSTTPKISWIVEDRYKPPWHAYLLPPEGYDDLSRIPLPTSPMTRIPSPGTSTIPLFSLHRLIYNSPKYDEKRGVVEQGVYEDAGLFYSLPLHPPPSQLIPSCKYPVPDGVINVHMFQQTGFCGCNGLYCLLAKSLGGMVAVFVWNPTGLSRQLPPFKDRRYLQYFGFGYDQSSDDYKVVKIDSLDHLVDVFSLYNSTSWRSLQGLPECAFRCSYSHWGVSVAGCLNWTVSVDHQAMVASFDLATERFQMLPLPPTYATLSHDLWRSSLWILDGYLSFVTLHDLSEDYGLSSPTCVSRVLDIWIMREYGVETSWTNAATIAFPHFLLYPHRILYLSKDVLILHVIPSNLLVFNLKQNSLVSPHILGFPPHSSGSIELFVQTEVSPYDRNNLTVRDNSIKITPDCDFSIQSGIEKRYDGEEHEEIE